MASVTIGVVSAGDWLDVGGAGAGLVGDVLAHLERSKIKKGNNRIGVNFFICMFVRFILINEHRPDIGGGPVKI